MSVSRTACLGALFARGGTNSILTVTDYFRVTARSQEDKKMRDKNNQSADGRTLERSDCHKITKQGDYQPLYLIKTYL
jgi:hypothetical protein